MMLTVLEQANSEQTSDSDKREVLQINDLGCMPDENAFV